MTKEQFKEELNRVFDDNLHTKQWHNIADWTIIGLIIISTLEVFLSTFDGIAERYGKILTIIDWVTQIFFTIEVTLRIWNADQVDPKYRGFWGRVRYCFSFYGLIDFLSTYPFYLKFFCPIPYMVLKVFRVARLLRVFRFMKSFRMLSSAISSKKKELGISLAFLVILTVILSFLLFFAEHAAQPVRFENGWGTLVWGFLKYLGDPGKAADFELATTWGNIIAVFIGVLGIAIFAVPAGLIGSGFTEVMEDEAKEKELKENAEAINEMMLVRSIVRGGLHFPAKNLSFGDLKLSLGLSDEEILKSVSKCTNLRVKNLRAALLSGSASDILVVNQFYANTPYGSYLERGSSVTIVNPLGIGDNGLSYYDWHLAELGGFNYVANEYYSRTTANRTQRCNFYTVDEETKQNAGFQKFAEDILKDRGENDWIIVVAGEQIVKEVTDFHFEFGGKKGESSFDFPECITHDKAKLKQLYDDFSSAIEPLNRKVDAHQVQPVLNPRNITRYLQSKTKANVLLITMSYKFLVFDNDMQIVLATVAEVLNRNLESRKPIGLHTEHYKDRSIHSSYWKDLYGVKMGEE